MSGSHDPMKDILAFIKSQQAKESKSEASHQFIIVANTPAVTDSKNDVYFNKNFYEILGVSLNADNNAIKKSYHKLAMMHHPDKNTHLAKDVLMQKEKIFTKIKEAFETLNDPVKKDIYDADLKKEKNNLKTNLFSHPVQQNNDEKHSMSVEDYIYKLERCYKYKSGVTGNYSPYISMASVSPSKLIKGIASMQPVSELEKILKDKEADANDTDFHGNNGIHIAIALNRKDYGRSVIELLIKHGCDVCHLNNLHQSPLYFVLHANQSCDYWHRFRETMIECGIVAADMKKYLSEYQSDYSFKRK